MGRQGRQGRALRQTGQGTLARRTPDGEFQSRCSRPLSSTLATVWLRTSQLLAPVPVPVPVPVSVPLDSAASAKLQRARASACAALAFCSPWPTCANQLDAPLGRHLSLKRIRKRPLLVLLPYIAYITYSYTLLLPAGPSAPSSLPPLPPLHLPLSLPPPPPPLHHSESSWARPLPPAPIANPVARTPPIRLLLQLPRPPTAQIRAPSACSISLDGPSRCTLALTPASPPRAHKEIRCEPAVHRFKGAGVLPQEAPSHGYLTATP
jgi:hypothetical protein